MSLSSPASTCRASTLTSLLFRSHTAVSVCGQGPGRWADAVVRARSVHTVAILTVGCVLALIYIYRAQRLTLKGLLLAWINPVPVISHTCYRYQHTLLLVGVRSPRLVTVAEVGAISVDTVAVSAQRLIVAFVHIWGSRCKEHQSAELTSMKCNYLLRLRYNRRYLFFTLAFLFSATVN